MQQQNQADQNQRQPDQVSLNRKSDIVTSSLHDTTIFAGSSCHIPVR
jgi:hypothetical protein